MAYVLRNTENKKFVEVFGDGSEGLVGVMSKAKVFEYQAEASEGQAEHDKWVGPLEIVEIQMGVKS